MDLQTKITLPPRPDRQIDYNSQLLLLGSCFAENIGGKLDYLKFRNSLNPFGIIFNPKSLETLINNAFVDRDFSEDDIFFHNERWQSYLAHSRLSRVSKEQLLSALNQAQSELKRGIESATHVIISLGSAWVYTLKDSGMIVANCH